MENTTIIFNSESDPKTIAEHINKVRRVMAKKNWYQITLENETSGKLTRLKIYHTWIQLAENPAFETVMDSSIRQFKKNLEKGIQTLINNY